MLEELKQYASVPDSSRDALLSTLLKSATLQVQEMADMTVLDCRVKCTYSDVRKGEPLRLYLNVGQILGCVDASGDSVNYRLDGRELTVDKDTDLLSVEYESHPTGDVSTLKMIIYRYATALYDGEDTSVLQSILKEAARYA